MLVFDIFRRIGFFIYLSHVGSFENPWFRTYRNYSSASLVVLFDFLVRYYLAHRKWRYLLQLTTIADIIVLFSLFIPTFIDNYAFLRILRALRILRSKHIMDDLRAQNSRYHPA